MQYSPGSNFGDLHWIWQCTAANIDAASKFYQPIIENLKRYPRISYASNEKGSFELFGLVLPSTRCVYAPEAINK